MAWVELAWTERRLTMLGLCSAPLWSSLKPAPYLQMPPPAPRGLVAFSICRGGCGRQGHWPSNVSQQSTRALGMK